MDKSELKQKQRELEQLKAERENIADELTRLSRRWNSLGVAIKGLQDYLNTFGPKQQSKTRGGTKIPEKGVTQLEIMPGQRPHLKPTILEVLRGSTKALGAKEIWQLAEAKGVQTTMARPQNAVYLAMIELVRKGLVKKTAPGRWRIVKKEGEAH